MHIFKRFLTACRSIVALLVEAPMAAGDSLTQELYSPHLDVHQRMLILETLATAAQQLSDPQHRLKAGHTSQTLLLQQESTSRSLIGQHAQNSHKVVLVHQVITISRSHVYI